MHGDWILSYPGTEYRFGPKGSAVELVSWEFSADSVRENEEQLPGDDATWFGPELLDAGMLRITVQIDLTEAALPQEDIQRRTWEERSKLLAAWRADPIRRSPTKLAELSMGGTQLIEGRTRPPQPTDVRLNVGKVEVDLYFLPATATAFPLTDGVAPWHELLVPPSGSAFDQGVPVPFVNDSTADAWPVITIPGQLGTLLFPVTLALVGVWETTITRVIPAGSTATIDTRPGRRLMLIDGTVRNLLATDKATISDLRIPPGPQQLMLRVRSAATTPGATVRWRTTE